MKGSWLNIFLLFAILGLSLTSCKKTDDLNDNKDPMLLSEFILGDDWSTPAEELGANIVMIAEFINNGTYTVTLTDGVEGIESLATGYWINNETNVLTMDRPEYPTVKKSISVDQNVFTVTWNENSNTSMTWSEVGEDDIIWTRP